MGVGVSPTPRPPLPPGSTRFPLYRRVGGPKAGLDGRIMSSPPGFDPGPSTRSQSPYFRVPDIILQCSQKAASGPSPVLLNSFCTFSQSWLLALGPVLLSSCISLRILSCLFSFRQLKVSIAVSPTHAQLFFKISEKWTLPHNPFRTKRVYWLQHQFSSFSLVKAKTECGQDCRPSSHDTSLWY
jgi:hypothetical protein